MSNSEMPVRVRTTPRDVFLHLLAAGLLYASAVSLITLLFQYVNRFFPDPLSYGYADTSGPVRWSVSMLIVLFPVLLWVTRRLNRDMLEDPGKARLAVRRWLMHFTLFVSGITILADLVTLVYRFLGGELSARFVLKVLAVLVVAGMIFGYFVWDVRRRDGGVTKHMQGVLWAAIGLVTGAVLGGFFLAGSPTRERDFQFDERRVSDLSMIQNEVVNYWTAKRALPEDVSALASTVTGFRAPVDPVTGMNYAYRVVDETRFELCAVFAAPSRTGEARPVPFSADPYGGTWEHGAGEVCFLRTIDPDFYPKPIR